MMKTVSIKQKIGYAAVAVLSLVGFFGLSRGLSFLISILCMDVLKLPMSFLYQYGEWLELSLQVIMLAVFFGVYKLIFGKQKQEYSGPFKFSGAALALVAGIGVTGISFLWMQLADKLPFLAKSLAAMDRSNSELSSGGGLFLVLTAVIGAPLLEEILFRGIIFRSLEKVKAGWFAIILSAVLFGIFHQNAVQAVYCTVMGIVAAVFYRQKRNLIYPILVHMANNLIGVFESYITSDKIMLALNIVTIIMIVPLVLIMIRLVKQPYETVPAAEGTEAVSKVINK